MNCKFNIICYIIFLSQNYWILSFLIFVNIKKKPTNKKVCTFRKNSKILIFHYIHNWCFFYSVRACARACACVCVEPHRFFKFIFFTIFKIKHGSVAPNMRLRLNGFCGSSQHVLKLLCFKNVKLRHLCSLFKLR
jgi:hypothetical protein